MTSKCSQLEIRHECPTMAEIASGIARPITYGRWLHKPGNTGMPAAEWWLTTPAGRCVGGHRAMLVVPLQDQARYFAHPVLDESLAADMTWLAIIGDRRYVSNADGTRFGDITNATDDIADRLVLRQFRAE